MQSTYLVDYINAINTSEGSAEGLQTSEGKKRVDFMN